ncbi:Catalytic subunit of protein kinase A [Operophtera brumata]|uniref:Catalytic subunit of protein kinase A n=1 Tax=Operophtera brumata TaxID=104452 RepID=A0A0L7KQ02_OPEBR|nr:Catalytic subunit of protein kinase A [Operophtera brumata]
MTFDRVGNEKTTFTHELQINHNRYLDVLKQEFARTHANPPVYVKSIDDYDPIRTLGTGSFGTVILVRDITSFTFHAMKVMDKTDVIKKKNVKQIHLEKKILQCANFPFVISIDFTCKDNLYLYFILPYEAGGELYTLIKRLGMLSEPLSLFYAAQMVLALEYLHHCSVIHRDVKPENILLNERGYIKLGDFGFCKIVKNRTWTLCGTPEYLAPEIITSKGYTFSVDWWATGVLIYEMCAGYPPFYSSDPMKLYEKVLTGQFKTPECMSSMCKSLVKGLLEVDSMKRLGSLKAGVYDIKSHLWFNEIDWQSILHQKVFRALEYPVELAKQEFHRERLVSQREYLIQFVVEYSGNNSEELSEHLAYYERVLEEASDGGLSLNVKVNFPPAEEKWSILQAVFFASTVLTTIADLGKVFATVVSVIAKQLPAMPKCCAKVSEANPTGQRSLYALGAVGFLFVYLSAGAGLFKMWEDDWTFYDGFYFCFVTMTTIGFGDLVPSPLADTLRRLGDAGRGVDVSSFHSDLRKVLTVI